MKKNLRSRLAGTIFLATAALSFITFSCSEKDSDLLKPKTITDVIRENERFSILRDIMLSAEMSDALRSDNVTFFAPDNMAFQRANVFSSAVYASNADSARKFLNNHLVKSRIDFGALKSVRGNTLENLNKRRLTLTFDADSSVFVNKAEILFEDVNADNGVIHVIDSLVIR